MYTKERGVHSCHVKCSDVKWRVLQPTPSMNIVPTENMVKATMYGVPHATPGKTNTLRYGCGVHVCRRSKAGDTSSSRYHNCEDRSIVADWTSTMGSSRHCVQQPPSIESQLHTLPQHSDMAAATLQYVCSQPTWIEKPSKQSPHVYSEHC